MLKRQLRRKKIVMQKVIDAHIHFGRFYDRYYKPDWVIKLLKQFGVNYFAISSTTTCSENYPKVKQEFESIRHESGLLPVMWITPYSLEGNIAWLLESDIKWKMLKIHPFLNKIEWKPNGSLFAEVLDIARELSLPLLIHTGHDECCRADLYEEAIKRNPDITFVLAHGRPIDSALDIAHRYDNAYVDTAFMPIEHIKRFVDSALSEKVLWGTDLCIPNYFDPDLDLCEYYNSRLHEVRSFCSDIQYEQITHENAQKLLNLE